MKLLEERIRRDGEVLPGDILKVGSFLNHRIDTRLLDKMGAEFGLLYSGSGITKILTLEASGIAIASMASPYFDFCPVIFAKKIAGKNVSGDVITSTVVSYTKGVTYNITVQKDLISPDDTILIIDDFLANGEALKGLVDIVNQSGAALAGAGIAIEKAYQPGGDLIRGMGIRVESLARIKSMDAEKGIEFCR